jgi:acetolactate decarboxylase
MFQEEKEKMKKVLPLVLGMALIFVLGGISGTILARPQPARDRDLLYQVSTSTSLTGGGFDPVESVGTLVKNGDLGSGTFTALDGEMVVVDGTCYQVTDDGMARPAALSQGVPFATVTFFSPDLSVPDITAANMTELTGFIDSQLPSRDQFYAIRITGNFPYVRARNVVAQDKPYPPLADALKEESVYEFRNVTGTAVGFYTPASAAGLNFPGYHLHFITADRSRGGHIIDMATMGTTVELDAKARTLVVMAPEGVG